MTNYIDGFVLPVPKENIETYSEVVKEVAKIWKEYGALDYSEYVIDDEELEGVQSFSETLKTKNHETVVFGWVVFESREARDIVNRKVSADPRMENLIRPLTLGARPIFDAKRMAYGGFRTLV